MAWLAERKDVLSSLFCILCVWAYARYVRESQVQSPKSKVFYWYAVVFFLLGLLSKPMAVTMPFVLLLLDYWPLNRIAVRGEQGADLTNRNKAGTVAGLAREKWPFFSLTVLFCFITWYSVDLGKNFPNEHFSSPLMRWANIPVAYARYLLKTVCPQNLAVLYPMPNHLPWWQVAAAIVILLVITWAVVRARRTRYLAFGWFLFLGMLVPTIGVVQVGVQAMADRYMYLPSLGLFVAAVWWAADVSAGWRQRRFILAGATILSLGACAWLSWVQTQYWRDSVSLWSHCLATGSESAIARYDLGLALSDAGEPQKAMNEYQSALGLDPDNRLVNVSYGIALVQAGRPAEATNYFARALAFRSGFR